MLAPLVTRMSMIRRGAGRIALPVLRRHTAQQLRLGFFDCFVEHSFEPLAAVVRRKRIGTAQLVSEAVPLSALNCTASVFIHYIYGGRGVLDAC